MLACSSDILKHTAPLLASTLGADHCELPVRDVEAATAGAGVNTAGEAGESYVITDQLQLGEGFGVAVVLALALGGTAAVIAHAASVLSRSSKIHRSLSSSLARHHAMGAGKKVSTTVLSSTKK